MKNTLGSVFLLLLTSANPLLAEVTVTVGEISDKRTTGQIFSGLEIKLLVAGAEMAKVKAMRFTIDKATDDTGKNLLDGKKSGFREDGFAPLEKPFGPKPKIADAFETDVNLANPPRTAKTVSLSGKIELLSPDADPASVITADLSKTAGKALDNATLKTAGVEITFEKPKDDSISYKIQDSNKKVAAIEFCGADGKPLKSNGSSSFGFDTTKNHSVSIQNLPDQVSAKIQLLTDKAMITVPVKLDGIKLP